MPSLLAQDTRVNCIILVNNELATHGFSNVYLTFGDANGVKHHVDYIPGELQIPDSTFVKLPTGERATATLHLSYNTFVNDKHMIENWSTELSAFLLKQPYLILKIYDFKNKAFRKMYGKYTDKSYLTEWRFPNSGVLIPANR